MTAVDRPPFQPYVGAEPFVFVCHAHADSAIVYPELIRLRDAGINVWYDEGITPGSEWTDGLANAIRDCAQFLYFVSPASVASRNCRDEVQYALKHRKRFVAVHLAPTELPGGLELSIGLTQAILKHRLAPDDYERRLMTSLGGESTVGDAVHRPDVTMPVVTDERTKARTRVTRLFVGMTLAVAIGFAAYKTFFWLPRTPTITSYTPLTTSNVLFSPFPSPQQLASDGVRIYFNEWRSGDFVPREVSIRGGESVPIPIPSGLPQFLAGTTADGSELLLGSCCGDDPWWLWSPAGASPRRVGTLKGHALSWSFDGTRLVNAVGNDLYVAAGDGSNPTKVTTAMAPVWPRLSPDGKRIRFSNGDGDQLWEVGADGTNPHQLFAGAEAFDQSCCGSWTPDGRHFVFQARRRDENHLWIVDEASSVFGVRVGAPRQLTEGAMHFIRPLIARDGRRLFALGWHLRGEVMRFDAASQRFEPHFGSRSVEWLTYSRDGRRVAYVTYPDGQLWTSDADGANPVQVTSLPMRPWAPMWSPDGKLVAFMNAAEEKIYVANGDASSSPTRLTRSDGAEYSPTWSADGRTIAFSRGGELGIRLVDLQSGTVSPLDGADAFFQPNWSPDGRYMSARALDPSRIVLFDFAASAWRDVTAAPKINYQAWSRDGLSISWVTEDPESDVFRIDIADGKVTHVVSLRKERSVWGRAGIWVGVAPDGSPLYLHDASVHHVYALDWSA